MSLSVTYADKWKINGHPDYMVTENGIVYNVKVGRAIKRCYKSRSVGYWLNGKFYTLNKLRGMLCKIPQKEYCPF